MEITTSKRYTVKGHSLMQKNVRATAANNVQKNRVVIENGEVKTLLFTETITPEEARQLLYDMIDLEYSLP